MSLSASSNSAQVTTNIVFGLAGTFIAIVTFWQTRRAWTIWHEHRHAQQYPSTDVELALRSTAPTSGDVRPAEPAHATIRPANQQYQLQNIASLDASSTTPTSGDPAESRHSSMATPADTEAITHVHPAQEIGAVHASAAAGDQGVPRITSPGRSQDDGRKAMITMDSHSLGLCRSEEVDGGHSSP